MSRLLGRFGGAKSLLRKAIIDVEKGHRESFPKIYYLGVQCWFSPAAEPQTDSFSFYIIEYLLKDFLGHKPFVSG
jgi:hypothetical protein